MRADRFHQACGRLPVRSLGDVCARKGVLVIAPHPDDETIGCGGLIRSCVEAGVPIHILVLSDGAGSHPNSRRYPKPALTALRHGESIAAARRLGLAADHVTFLDLPDGAVPSSGPVVDRIVDAALALEAGTIFVTWRHDPHCDHAAAAALVDAARVRLPSIIVHAYAIWGWTLPSDRDVGAAPSGFRLDVTRHLAAKRAAVAEHRSQITALIDDDPNGFRLRPAMLERFAQPFEAFILVAP